MVVNALQFERAATDIGWVNHELDRIEVGACATASDRE
jgi:hypothetical protein